MEMTEQDREFRKRFWAARLEHGSVRSGQDGAASRNHRDACSLASDPYWAWVAGLLDASLKSLSGHLQESKAALAQVENAVPAQHKCLVVFLHASLAYLDRDQPRAL